jgi:hypothetical protein
MMNGKGFGRKMVRPDRGIILKFPEGTDGHRIDPVRIEDVSKEYRSEHLQNTSKIYIARLTCSVTYQSDIHSAISRMQQSLLQLLNAQ